MLQYLQKYHQYIKFRKLDRYDQMQIVISYLLRLLMILFALQEFTQQNFLLGSLISFFIILTFIPSIIEHNYKILLPIEIEFFTTVFVFLSVILGDIHRLYEIFWWWDIFLHVLGGILFGLLGFVIVYLMIQYSHNSVLRPSLAVIFSFCFAVTIEVIWEVIEYLIGMNTGYIMQANLQDTMHDLMLTSAGAMLASYVVYIYLKKQTKVALVHRVLHKFLNKKK